MFEGMIFELLKNIGIWSFVFGTPVYLLCRQDKTAKLFKACGIQNKDKKIPIVYSEKKQPYGYDLTLHLPEGLCVSDIQRHLEAIETSLGAKVELLPSTNQKAVLKAYTKHLKSLYPYEQTKLKGLSFPLGYSHKGLLTHTMDDENPHMLVGGQPGSGKSVLLRVIITSVIQNKSAILHLCDLKGGIEFSRFKKSSQVQTFAKNMSEAATQLIMLKEEMYRRLNLFEQTNVVGLDQYNKKTRSNLPRHLLIIDELANITLENDSLTETICELLRMARAVGIHIILATQRPDAKVLPGILKANISATVSFKCRNFVNSEILLDHKGAENLRGKGNGIYQAVDEVEFQGLLLEADEAENLVKHTYVEKSMEVFEIGVKRRDNATRSTSA